MEQYVRIFAVLLVLFCCPLLQAFVLDTPRRRSRSSSISATTTTTTTDDNNDEDEILTARVARARALIDQSKAKMAATAAVESPEPVVPFFAVLDRAPLIHTQDNGGLTVDGEGLAALSEGEEWEPRSLGQVFTAENDQKRSSDPLASRDVAASIFNLRKTLQTGDYQRIFDKRNRFIGEDT